MPEETKYTLTVFGPELVVYEERGNKCVVGPPHLKDYWLSWTDDEKADDLAWREALDDFTRKANEVLRRKLSEVGIFNPLAGTVFETPDQNSQTPASPSQP